MPAVRDRALSAMEVEAVLGLDVPLREQVLWKWLYESAARTQELLLLDVPGLDPANRLGKIVRNFDGGTQSTVAAARMD
jgi:hypothetical protein